MDVLSVLELLTLAQSDRNVVMAARAANAGDLRYGHAQDPGVDEAELTSRASAAWADLRALPADAGDAVVNGWKMHHRIPRP